MRRIIALCLATAAVFALSACSNSATVDHSGHSDHSSETSTAEFSADDVMFAQMMIPHHEQAVELSYLAIEKSQDAQLIELARAIITHQSSEVTTMTEWIESAGATRDDSHSMHMQGMLTEEQMNEIKAASAAEFDRLWLEGMIAHHEGAVLMAEDVTDSKNATVADFASHVIEDQTAEIVLMKELLG